ncbi:MAG: FtsX-like permease family protein, partial [Bacteroidota bacterium]
VSIVSNQGVNAFPSKMAIKLSGKEVKETVSEVEDKWQTFVGGSPFQFYFLNEDLALFYKAEKATGQIFGIFTFLAIVIACVGLLGLSAYVINQKVKEIGVRKVLGASVSSIIILLAKDFAKLVGIASVLAIPASYLWMSKWLENFAYSVSLNWGVFLLSGFSALIIAITTISFQSIKAAQANPIKSLKDE